MEGFTPRSQENWDVVYFSKGCKRKIPLNCQKGEGVFIKLEGVKLPDLLDFQLDKNISLEECEFACLKKLVIICVDCSCTCGITNLLNNLTD